MKAWHLLALDLLVTYEVTRDWTQLVNSSWHWWISWNEDIITAFIVFDLTWPELEPRPPIPQTGPSTTESPWLVEFDVNNHKIVLMCISFLCRYQPWRYSGRLSRCSCIRRLGWCAFSSSPSYHHPGKIIGLFHHSITWCIYMYREIDYDIDLIFNI